MHFWLFMYLKYLMVWKKLDAEEERQSIGDSNKST